MKRIAAALSCLCLLSSPFTAHGADWEGPQAPFALYGTSYYVGTQGLSAVLVTSPAGHILIDGAGPNTPLRIAANIRQLGFKPEDIKYIQGRSAVRQRHAGHGTGGAGKNGA